MILRGSGSPHRERGIRGLLLAVLALLVVLALADLTRRDSLIRGLADPSRGWRGDTAEERLRRFMR